MSAWGNCDFSQFEKFTRRVKAMAEDMDKLYRDCAKELAARLLRDVIKNTAVSDGIYEAVFVYDAGHDSGDFFLKRVGSGGTLRRGWMYKTQKEAETNKKNKPVKDIVSELNIIKNGSSYRVDIVNCVEYASYYEYGHRQRPGRFVPQIGKSLKSSFVEGHFVMTNAEAKVNANASKIVEKKVNEYLKGMMR